MRRILTIATITIRGAIRSRVVATLLALLLLAVVGLPLTVRGDGTLAGYVQILLRYTLGFAAVLLAIQTIWIGCAAISTEIADRRIQLVVTKPVHSLQIWAGKWLGILILNALLLGATGLAAYGLLRWETRPGRLSAADQRRLREEVLTARRRVAALPMDLDTPAQQILAERRAAGAIPREVPPQEALEAIRERLRIEASAVGPGFKRRWRFKLPARPGRSQILFLEYKLSSSRDVGEAVAGLWLAGPADNPEEFEQDAASAPGGVYALRIPAEAVGTDGRLVVEYANVHPEATTVLFEENDVALLLQEGSFEANYVRALLVVFIELAFFAAIGLAAGTFFSMPVAAFVSGWFVLLIGMGDYLRSMAAQATYFDRHGAASAGPGFWDHFFRTVFRALSALVQPLRAADPLELLAVGRLVSWPTVAADFAVRLVLYSGVLALVSAWVLSRREIGMAE